MLKDEMVARGISINALARALRVPPNRMSAIVTGRRGITADTALRLARFFSTTPQLWMNLQNEYDLRSADQARIEREVLPAEEATGHELPGGLVNVSVSPRNRGGETAPKARSRYQDMKTPKSEIGAEHAHCSRRSGFGGYS
jgi:addiction module HigA family antidote